MSIQKTRVAGHMAAIFTMLIWGTTFISTKVLLESLSPLEILVLRFVAGYIFLWLIRPVPLKMKSCLLYTSCQYAQKNNAYFIKSAHIKQKVIMI